MLNRISAQFWQSLTLEQLRLVLVAKSCWMSNVNKTDAVNFLKSKRKFQLEAPETGVPGLVLAREFGAIQAKRARVDTLGPDHFFSSETDQEDMFNSRGRSPDGGKLYRLFQDPILDDPRKRVCFGWANLNSHSNYSGGNLDTEEGFRLDSTYLRRYKF